MLLPHSASNIDLVYLASFFGTKKVTALPSPSALIC